MADRSPALGAASARPAAGRAPAQRRRYCAPGVEIALFVTCVNDAVFPGTGRAVVEVLERLGHRVAFPKAQTCCGQMHLNSGYRPEAARLARRVVEVLSPYEHVVVPSASCAGTMREMYAYLGATCDDPRLATASLELAPRVHELSELLVDVLGVTDVGAEFEHSVAYHPTCHSLRTLHLGDRPRRLLEAVRGLELVGLPGATSCCGFGGTFALKNADTSAAMVADKVRAVSSTEVEFLCAADNSCLTQIGGAGRRAGAGFEVIHLAEILASTSAAAGPVAGRAGPASTNGARP
jgi:L-lactate dehydrogenase complex protein LldE